MDFFKRTWAEIDLDNLSHNLTEFRNKIGAATEIMCVVKADAYGHGDSMIVSSLLKCGVRWFAVSNLEEALSLRRLGKEFNVIILGITPVQYASILFEQNIIQTIHCLDYGLKLAQVAEKCGVVLDVHVKIDTGMGRIGFDGFVENSDNTVMHIKTLNNLPSYNVNGIFTHFSVSDELEEDAVSYTQSQYERFENLCGKLENNGINFLHKHCCNTGGIINHSDMYMDMVRLGIGLYGLYQQSTLNLRPVMTLKTSVSMIKELSADRDISYGRSYKTDKPTKLATLPVGYADGYSRSLSNRGYVIIQGKSAPIVGKICMDQTVVDVTNIENIQLFDEVTLFGEGFSFNDAAKMIGTIHYELVCGISKRVPRVYFSSGKQVAIVDYLFHDTLK